MNLSGTARLTTVEGTGLRFEARFVSGQVLTTDGNKDADAPSPVQALVAALATCEAMDVISLLRKQRQQVTAYEVVMEIERAAEHPKRLTAVRLTHRVTGHAVNEACLAEAIRLSEEKYCSVHHSLDPAMPVTSRIEILEG